MSNSKLAATIDGRRTYDAMIAVMAVANNVPLTRSTRPTSRGIVGLDLRAVRHPDQAEGPHNPA
jgi:hypothetical protein